MTSSPIFWMRQKGMTMPSLALRRPSMLLSPGTTMERIVPVHRSISRSVTQPSLPPSHTLMTSLHFRSENVVLSSIGASFLLYPMRACLLTELDESSQSG